MTDLFIGVDVGSKSARAALVSSKGEIIKLHVEPIDVYNTQTDHYEQSSKQIWAKVCYCIKYVSSSVDKKDLIKGIGFDATCSMVVLDKNFHSVSVSNDLDEEKDVIMWMDHRANEETTFINSVPHKVLKYVGGQVSIEMQMPKLLWLKKNIPESWFRASNFFDLPDFLTFKATGKLVRSLCSLVCKWSYQHTKSGGGWDDDFLTAIGLPELTQDNHKMIGEIVQAPGSCCGGLSKEAAIAMGLLEGTSVGTSILDAHAGGLGLLSSTHESLDVHKYTQKLGLICGTSTCHMTVSEEPLFVPGVWGPFYSAMVPGLWLAEGGQSATGRLIDHIIEGHPAAKQCPQGTSYYPWLESHLTQLKSKHQLANVGLLTKNIHVYPDFHGNRSPLADNSFRGMICGLTLDASIESLALLYLATVQALAFGTKDIVNQLESYGHVINSILACGGLTKSQLFLSVHADVLGLSVLIPNERQSVLLGTAMLAVTAYDTSKSLPEVGRQMGSQSTIVERDHASQQFYAKKFKVFEKMQRDWVGYSLLMKDNE